MSIEVMYPSRSQSRAQNPLFAREIRRRKLCFMLAFAAISLGLLLLQLVPMTAHADGAAFQSQPAAITSPVKAEPAAGKTVRQIQLYDIPAR